MVYLYWVLGIIFLVFSLFFVSFKLYFKIYKLRTKKYLNQWYNNNNGGGIIKIVANNFSDAEIFISMKMTRVLRDGGLEDKSITIDTLKRTYTKIIDKDMIEQLNDSLDNHYKQKEINELEELKKSASSFINKNSSPIIIPDDLKTHFEQKNKKKTTLTNRLDQI